MRRLAPLILAVPLAAQDPVADLATAHNLARTGEYEKAEPLLETLVRAHPTELRAWLDLYRIHALQGAHEKASETLDRALEALPDHPALLTARAELLLARGREEDALALLEGVVARDDKLVRARYLRDRLWLLRGKRDEAEKDLDAFYQLYNEGESFTSEELTELARGLWLSATRKGERSTQKKVADGSAGLLVDATRIDPDNADAHILWGQCFLEKHDADAARKAFSAALKIHPKHPDAHVGMAGVMWEEGRLDAAETSARRALLCDPTHAAAHLLIARVAVERGDKAAYAAAIEAAPEHVRSSPEAHVLAAAHAWLRGDADGFTEAHRLYALERPAGGDLFLFVADLLARRLRFAEAMELYARALAADPHETRAAVGYALALLRTGDEENGWKAMENAYARDPFNLWAKETVEYFVSVHQEYVPTETMHVTVRMHHEEANLLAAYVPPMAEGAWQWIADRVTIEGPAPLRLDVVPNVALFQQRTVGLPWARPPVAAFGTVAVVLSPNLTNRQRAGAFSWSHAVRSAVAQAWLVHGSQGRLPLPLLSGLADALLPAPPSWDVEVLRAIDAGTLPSREELLAGVPGRDARLLQGAARAAGTTIGIEGVASLLEACRRARLEEAIPDYPAKVPGRRPGRLRIPTDPKRAEELRASLTGGATDAEPLARLAEIAMANGRGAEALRLAGQSLALDPKQPLALRVQGQAQATLGRWVEARTSYEAAIAAGADDAETWVALAEAMQTTDKSDRRETLTRARDRCPEWTGKGSPHDLLAAACEEANDAEGLLAALAAWSAAAPEDDETAMRLARALADAGRAEEALAAYERAIEADLLDMKGHVEAGDLAIKLGRAERALTAYGTAILLLEGLNQNHRYDRPLAGLYVKRAGAYQALAKTKECRIDLKRALILDPGNPEAEAMLRTVGE